MDVSEVNPFKSWLSDPAWNDILALCELPAFKDFKQNFKSNAIKWEETMNVNSPMESISALLGDGMDGFKKLCVLRCIRPDAVVRERERERDRERENIPYTLLHFVLFYFLLFSSILVNFIFFYSILFYSVLFNDSILFTNVRFYSTLLYSTLLYSILLYSTLFYSTLFYSTLLYSTLLYSTLFFSALLDVSLCYHRVSKKLLKDSSFPFLLI